MPVIIDYILKLSICLAVVYLFYQLLLRRLTFYNWNRWYLLGYSALSFVIPLIDIMPELQKKQLDQSMLVQLIPALGFASAADNSSFLESLTIWDWVLVVGILGSVVLLTRFLIMFFSFLKIKSRAQLISDDDTRIYQLDEDMRPFSFGNAIFINTELHSGEELEEIIRHEFVHVKQKHTIDIVWSELLCILLWFNPFVWLLRKSIKQNLEFLADKQVLQGGVDKKEYQYLLLKVMGNKQFAFTNHFNFSSLKNRIAMMNTIKSAKVHLTKFLFLLPVIAVLLLAFRKEVLHESTGRRTSSGELLNAPDAATDSIRTPVNLQLALIRKDTTPVKGAAKKYDVIVTGSGFGRNIKDPSVIVKRMSIAEWKAHQEKYEKEYGIAPLLTINKRADNNINKFDSVYVMKKTLSNTLVADNPLIIVDGEKVDNKGGKALEGIDPNRIQSISVLKDKAATSLYGADGKNGVIIITSKKNDAVKSDSAANTTVTFKKTLKYTYNSNEFKAVPVDVTLKGKATGISVAPASADQPNHSGEQKVMLTFHPAKNGEQAPLFVLNGEVQDHNVLKELDPADLESVAVLKDASAKTLYGNAARNGAVLVTTKTGHRSGSKKDPLQEVIVRGYGTKSATESASKENEVTVYPTAKGHIAAKVGTTTMSADTFHIQKAAQ
ncbi:hypothetical protein A8C56_15195 [Niabella ginsenosidivorans]|uniref:Peptidase M56 domain-containing protein n=1 Tax=Niabella ginsenosidivorans TaxID=1176587 RepID=A0A1A9I3D9_9BACT|nr:M56 family metallopeptidase [Niabella ginsenosidivorans]ANH82136.1 hypothetical protein A8C56_15195 [Niabella ginsenosidivorans]